MTQIPCCCPVTKPCPTLCDPVDCSTPGFPVLHYLPEFAQIPAHFHILCCPLLLLPSIFPSIRVFPSESAVHIRWPKYWSFSFSITSLQMLILFKNFFFVLLMIVNSHREFLINRFGIAQTSLPFYNKVPSVMGAGEKVLIWELTLGSFTYL